MALVLDGSIGSHDPGTQGTVLQHALDVSGFGGLRRVEFEGDLAHGLGSHEFLGPVNRSEIAVAQPDQQTVSAVSHRLSAQFRNIHISFLLMWDHRIILTSESRALSLVSLSSLSSAIISGSFMEMLSKRRVTLSTRLRRFCCRSTSASASL